LTGDASAFGISSRYVSDSRNGSPATLERLLGIEARMGAHPRLDVSSLHMLAGVANFTLEATTAASVVPWHVPPQSRMTLDQTPFFEVSRE